MLSTFSQTFIIRKAHTLGQVSQTFTNILMSLFILLHPFDAGPPSSTLTVSLVTFGASSFILMAYAIRGIIKEEKNMAFGKIGALCN